MKKLIFTLVLVALSGSNLFGANVQTRPIPGRLTQTNQTRIAAPTQSGFRAEDDPQMTQCLEGKVSKNATDEEIYQAYQECLQELYPGGKGVIYY